MQVMTVEDATALANRSIQESWDIMINLLKERHLERFAERLQQPPTVVWKPFRSMNVAAWYRTFNLKHPKKNFSKQWKWDDVIEMNSDYLTSPDAERFVWETSKHELGHCINFRLNNRTGHDKSFKAIVEAIGGNSATCHNYDLTDKQRKKMHKFTCKCGKSWWVTNYWVKKFKSGNYLCKECEANLNEGTFTSEE